MMENMIRLLVKRPGCSPELTTVDEDIWAKSRAEILDGLVGGARSSIEMDGNFAIMYSEADQRRIDKSDSTLTIADAELYGTVVLTRLDADKKPISLWPVEDLPPALQVAFFGTTSEDWVC